MVGIESCGVYIPLWRLDLGAIEEGLKGEKAIASYDEDSLTMGVAAGINALYNIDRRQIDGVFFATTTSPYKEKQISVTAATALDLRDDLLTADFCNSLRGGTIALKAALDTVKAGSAKKIVVIAADTRLPQPGSDFERLFGDGAAAFVVSDQDVGASVKDSHSISDEILDMWRADEDKFVRSWEGRFTLDEGYFRVLPVPVMALMQTHNLTAKDFSQAVFPGPDARRHREMADKLGFSVNQIQVPMFGVVGDTGTAFSPIMLAAALENAKAGDKILLANYGSGADAFLLEVHREFKVWRGIKSSIASKKLVKNYKTYLVWRELMEMMTGRRRPSTPSPSASAIWRERDRNIRLHGVKCRQCGTIQYPPQRVCCKCHARDNFESYRFSDKRAKLFTFAKDYVSPTPDPPLIVAVADFEDGGRIWLYLTDGDENAIQIGMPLEMTFRKLFTMEGIHNYYWKCAPIRIQAESVDGEH